MRSKLWLVVIVAQTLLILSLLFQLTMSVRQTQRAISDFNQLYDSFKTMQTAFERMQAANTKNEKSATDCELRKAAK